MLVFVGTSGMAVAPHPPATSRPQSGPVWHTDTLVVSFEVPEHAAGRPLGVIHPSAMTGASVEAPRVETNAIDRSAATTAALAPALTTTISRSLAFGNVYPGMGVQTVLPTDATRSGQYSLSATGLKSGKSQFSVYFVLPTSASRVGGGATMPVSFSATSAGYAASGVQAAQIAFNPNTATSSNRYRNDLQQSGNTGSGKLWIGATATPSTTQTAGTYNISIVSTWALTGN